MRLIACKWRYLNLGLWQKGICHNLKCSSHDLNETFIKQVNHRYGMLLTNLYCMSSVLYASILSCSQNWRCYICMYRKSSRGLLCWPIVSPFRLDFIFQIGSNTCWIYYGLSRKHIFILILFYFNFPLHDTSNHSHGE